MTKAKLSDIIVGARNELERIKLMEVWLNEHKLVAHYKSLYEPILAALNACDDVESAKGRLFALLKPDSEDAANKNGKKKRTIDLTELSKEFQLAAVAYGVDPITPHAYLIARRVEKAGEVGAIASRVHQVHIPHRAQPSDPYNEK